MTATRVRAAQDVQGPPPPRMVPVTIATVSPLKVLLPGSTVPVAGVEVAGLTYTSGGPGFALVQEPAVGPVFPTAS